MNVSLDLWSIPKSECHVFLRDEDSAMKKGFLHADCGAHKMNLVVKSIFYSQDVKDLLEKRRTLLGHFNHSNLACDRLKEEQLSIELPVHRLIQDVSTRWNSSIYMCRRLLEQKAVIDLYLLKYKKRQLELTDAEWIFVDKLTKLLDPLESASKQMCLDSSPISVSIPDRKSPHRNN